MSLGTSSNSECHLTADGPGEFWCPVCGQRRTSTQISGTEYGHALDSPERPADHLIVQDRVSGIIDRYEDRIIEPLSTVHGRKLRDEVFEESEAVPRTGQAGETQEKAVEETVSRGSQPLIAAVEVMLERLVRQSSTKERSVEGG
ncbi:hypothetical protein [Halorubrum trueperi]|uniref:Uncharacterized protein n=1 Tax=Halorubrum trueperi TaxID=2004704 RepID=A0ABD5UK42_9EURY